MSKPKLLVAPCEYKAAKYAVEKWHYSQSMPTPPVVKFGVWENDTYIGAVLFSRGANKNLGKAYGLVATQVCELSRVALSTHFSQTSQIVSICLKLLKKEFLDVELVYSYADSNQDHVGSIYQAMNWIYTGKTPNSFKYQTSSGKILHQRQVSVSGQKPQYGEMRNVPKISDCVKIPQEGKYRYLYPLNRAMRKQIEPLALPYPKKTE